MEISCARGPVIAVIVLAFATFVSPVCDFMKGQQCAMDANAGIKERDCEKMTTAIECTDTILTSDCTGDFRQMLLDWNKTTKTKLEEICPSDGSSPAPAPAECDRNDYNTCDKEYSGGLVTGSCGAMKHGVDCFKGLDTSNCDSVMKKTIASKIATITTEYDVKCLGQTTEAPIPSDKDITTKAEVDDTTTEKPKDNDNKPNDNDNKPNDNDNKPTAKKLQGDSAPKPNGGMVLILMSLISLAMLKIIA